MVHRRRGASPRLETLEPVTLLSGVTTLAAAPSTPVEVAPMALTTLGGTLKGGVREHQLGDWVVYDFDIKAVGKLTPIGAATSTGYLEEDAGPGDYAAICGLELITSDGTLTLRLDGPTAVLKEQPTSTAPREIRLAYNITGGSGAYRDDVGTGIAKITITSSRTVKGIQADGVEIKFTSFPINPIGPGLDW